MKEKIELIQGDITQLKVDAIVNAANTSLLGGGGVDGAIHRAGGQAILKECMQIRDRQGGCPVGEAVITTAGKLPASYVIHTVGPRWNGGTNEEPTLLTNAYRNTLQLAIENQIRTLAFPNISTGIYRYPKEAAAEIALQTVKKFLEEDNPIDKIFFVCFDEDNYQIYAEKIEVLFPDEGGSSS